MERGCPILEEGSGLSSKVGGVANKARKFRHLPCKLIYSLNKCLLKASLSFQHSSFKIFENGLMNYKQCFCLKKNKT